MSVLQDWSSASGLLGLKDLLGKTGFELEVLADDADNATVTMTTTSTPPFAMSIGTWALLGVLLVWAAILLVSWFFNRSGGAAQEDGATSDAVTSEDPTDAPTGAPRQGSQPGLVKAVSSALSVGGGGQSANLSTLDVDPIKAIENHEQMKLSDFWSQLVRDIILGTWLALLLIMLILNFQAAMLLVLLTLIALTAMTLSSTNLPEMALVAINVLLFSVCVLYGIAYSVQTWTQLLSFEDYLNPTVLMLLVILFLVAFLASPMTRPAMLGNVILGLAAALMVISVVTQVVSGFLSETPDIGLSRLQAAMGTCVLIGGSVAVSSNIVGIPIRVALSGLLVQYYLGLFVLGTTIGEETFSALGVAAGKFLDFSDVGASFVFGGDFRVVFFAFKVLPTTIFFSAFTSCMFYLGALQAIVRGVSSALEQTVGTSLVQSVNAAANLFLGQTEAPLLIRPFLATASPCDIHCVMVGGFASIAGGVLAAYIGMGISADQLLGASVMSVPGTLVVANLLVPPGSFPEEIVEEEEGKEVKFEFPPVTETNIIEAAGNGTQTAIFLVLNIGAMLIAFLSLISLVDAGLGYIGGLVDVPQLSFEYICGFVFWPIAWLLGVASNECYSVAQLIGKKIFVNEFVAYGSLSELAGTCQNCDGTRIISERAELIATYACCGFSNVGSIGVMLGGLGSLCPQRGKLFAKVVTKAMIGGNLVCFLTATFAALIL